MFRFVRFTFVGECLAICGFCAFGVIEADAQSSGKCQPNLQYLQTAIPTTGYPQLDALRTSILATDIQEVVSKMADQHMSIDRAISLANGQADLDSSNLASIETSIRAAAELSKADVLMEGLKRRDYSNIGFQEDVLSAAERSYAANDWGQLATERQPNNYYV